MDNERVIEGKFNRDRQRFSDKINRAYEERFNRPPTKAELIRMCV